MAQHDDTKLALLEEIERLFNISENHVVGQSDPAVSTGLGRIWTTNHGKAFLPVNINDQKSTIDAHVRAFKSEGTGDGTKGPFDNGTTAIDLEIKGTRQVLDIIRPEIQNLMHEIGQAAGLNLQQTPIVTVQSTQDPRHSPPELGTYSSFEAVEYDGINTHAFIKFHQDDAPKVMQAIVTLKAQYSGRSGGVLPVGEIGSSAEDRSSPEQKLGQ